MKHSLSFTAYTLIIFILHLSTCLLSEDNATSGGDIFKELPTLHCLGVRWPILGDANKNAIVHVFYKEKKSAKWLNGFPLLRTLPNPHSSNKSAIHTVENGWMFAGSIMGLQPDTEYEVKLNLIDPDGANIIKTIEMRTWSEPIAPNSLVKKFVSPGEGGGDGSEGNPYLGTAEVVKHLEPGVVFLFAEGLYAPFKIDKSGTLEKPIVFRNKDKGEVVFDGGGAYENDSIIINFVEQKHIWFEGLTFKKSRYGLLGHKATHAVIRNCTFRDVYKGIEAIYGDYETTQHFFIADNDYIGVATWPRKKGIESLCLAYVSGGGHVIAYNRIWNTGDAVHGTGHGSWSACDIYANEMNVCTDDGIETDHCEFNIRVWGNRIFNVIHGVTSQPSRGGPVYIFRNVIYNATYSPFKLHNHTTGVYLFHNTCFKFENGFNISPADETVTNIQTRNNLFLCHKGLGLNATTSNIKQFDFDNDGFGGFSKFAYWNHKYTFKGIDDAKKDSVIYFERGAVLIDPKTCFINGALAPSDESKIYNFEDIDYRLAEKSDAIDRGVVLFNINDQFKGKAPDLGAIEYGDPIPAYGPRKKTTE